MTSLIDTVTSTVNNYINNTSFSDRDTDRLRATAPHTRSFSRDNLMKDETVSFFCSSNHSDSRNPSPIQHLSSNNIQNLNISKCENVQFGDRHHNYNYNATQTETTSEHLQENQNILKIFATMFKSTKTIIWLTVITLSTIVLLALIYAVGHSASQDDCEQLHMVTRTEWNAKPLKKDLPNLELPSAIVIIAHTCSQRCSTEDECSSFVRRIQDEHMNITDGIAYNFLIGDDGFVYAGTGWNKQGFHTQGHNARSVCIAFIGTFDYVVPSNCQLTQAQKLLEEGVQANKLSKAYRVYGQRQLEATNSPGQALYYIIQTWSHYARYIPPSVDLY